MGVGDDFLAFYIPIQQHIERPSHRDEQTLSNPLHRAHLHRRCEMYYYFPPLLILSDPARRNDRVHLPRPAHLLRHDGSPRRSPRNRRSPRRRDGHRARSPLPLPAP